MVCFHWLKYKLCYLQSNVFFCQWKQTIAHLETTVFPARNVAFQRQQRSRQTRTLNAQTESAVILFVDSNDFKKAIQSIFYNLLVVSRFLTISHAFLEKKNTNLTIFNQARLACLMLNVKVILIYDVSQQRVFILISCYSMTK